MKKYKEIYDNIDKVDIFRIGASVCSCTEH